MEEKKISMEEGGNLAVKALLDAEEGRRKAVENDPDSIETIDIDNETVPNTPD